MHPVGAATPCIQATDRLPVRSFQVSQLGLRHLGLVGGGTGLAPLLQIVRAMLADKQDTTRISLLCVNRHETDILMCVPC